jgi:hypothetical protein
VGLNQSPRLAVDPEGVVPPPPPADPPGGRGPRLTVDPLVDPPDDSVSPVGRFRIPRG